MTSIRSKTTLVVACLASLTVGIFLADVFRSRPALAQQPAHAPANPGAKAPIQEVLHCPLAFAGVHLLKDLPQYSQVAYHYCKPVSDEVNQCVLYDGTGPDAKLIGIEYLVSEAIFHKMSAEEKVYWHDHKYEVDAGLLKSLTQTGDEEKKTLGAVRTLYGKVFHTWAAGKTYPTGPPRLFWAVTGEEPFVLAKDAKLPTEMKPKHAEK